MKKGWFVLFVLTAALMCVFTGIFIGRIMVAPPAADIPDETLAKVVDKSFQNGKININHAGVNELIQLPGIGEELAKRIIAYRTEHGPYTCAEDLLNVNGIGPVRLKQIQTHITIGG